MDTPTFNATRFVRPALRSIVVCSLAIVISSMMMVNPAHAEGTVTPQRTSYCATFFYVGGYVAHACSSSFSAACAALGGGSYSAACGGYCVTDSSCSLPAYVYGNQSFSTTSMCPDHSTGTPAINPTICTCDAGYVPDTTQTSCVLPACPAHASGTPCACDAGYKFDAAGTNCVSTCPVDPLPKPPPPFSDACSNSLEKGRGVDIDNACAAGLTPDMQDGVKCVSDKIHALAIPYTGPSATIRTEAYQNHLLAVWNKSEEIKNKDDWLPGEKQACAAVITDVNNEMGWHGIDSPPSSSEDLAPHVLGRAIDIPRNVAKTLIAQVTNTTFVANCIVCLPLPVITGDVQDYVNSSRINPPACNLNWGGRFKKPRPDPVHFQLP
jgi:hypothetical protein